MLHNLKIVDTKEQQQQQPLPCQKWWGSNANKMTNSPSCGNQKLTAMALTKACMKSFQWLAKSKPINEHAIRITGLSNPLVYQSIKATTTARSKASKQINEASSSRFLPRNWHKIATNEQTYITDKQPKRQDRCCLPQNTSTTPKHKGADELKLQTNRHIIAGKVWTSAC